MNFATFRNKVYHHCFANTPLHPDLHSVLILWFWGALLSHVSNVMNDDWLRDTALSCLFDSPDLQNKLHALFSETWKQWLRPWTHQDDVHWAQRSGEWEAQSLKDFYTIRQPEESPPAGHQRNCHYKTTVQWMATYMHVSCVQVMAALDWCSADRGKGSR